MKSKSFTTSGIYWTTGNTKVSVPVLNLGSATNCPSANWCPFSRENYKAAGRPWCYAQKTEARFRKVLTNRTNNETAISALEQGSDRYATLEVARNVAISMAIECRKTGAKYIRINESGDLCAENIRFTHAFVRECDRHHIRVYTYSRAPQKYRTQLRAAGAVVLDSESDFVCVRDEAEAAEKGLPLCPGVGCGKSCLRCPMGKRSAVIAH
jgi:hypothetical protein